MKVLVTGGAGFIASHVVDALVEAGREVVVVDNLSTGFRENVNPRAKLIEMDIRDERIARVFAEERPEAVDHHAAQMDVRRSVREPIYDASVNVLGTLNILEGCRAAGVRKFVYVSTGGAVYGEPRAIPVPEDHPIDAMSPYGVTKHTVEHYLKIYRQEFDLEFTVLRYANIYGPRQSPHGEAGVVAIFSENLLQGKPCTIFGDGSKTRDYVYISDVVAANLLALLEGKGPGGIFNLGTGIETTDQRIFDLVAASLGMRARPLYDKKRAGEIDHIALACERARSELGWEPRVGLEEGIGRATAFYREKLKRQGLT